MSDLLTEYLLRYDAAKSQGLRWQSHFESAYAMFFPDRNMYNSDGNIAQRKNLTLYDMTGLLAARTFVAQLHVSLTPIGQKWLILEAGKDADPNVDAVKAALVKQAAEQLTEIIFDYINSSNFHMAMNEAYYDLAVGTGALIVNEGEDPDYPFVFSSPSLNSYYPEEGPYGSIETIWRDFSQLPYRLITRMWAKAKIPQILAQQSETKADFAVDLIEGSVYDPKKKKYHYCVIHKESQSFLFEEWADSSQWIVFRGFKRQNEVFGRGPAIDALPTMQTLNKIYEDELRSAAFASSPIWIGVHDGVFNPNMVKIEPNTIYYANAGVSPSNPPLFPIPQGGNPQFAQLQVNDLRQQIKEIFFTDPLGTINDPTKTATEIMIRNQMALENKLPYFGRLQSELLEKLTQRLVYVLIKTGKIPPLKVDGKQFMVRYKSPLVQSQNLAETNNIVKFAQTIQSIAGPQLALMVFNAPNLFTELAEKMEVPIDVIKDKVTLQQVVDQLTQQQTQQQPQLPTPPQGGLQQPMQQ